MRWERARVGSVDADDPAGAGRRRADRRLVLAAVLFGLAAGNHSLTLLLVPPIALYVLSVEPGICAGPRFVLALRSAAAFGDGRARVPRAADPRPGSCRRR